MQDLGHLSKEPINRKLVPNCYQNPGQLEMDEQRDSENEHEDMATVSTQPIPNTLNQSYLPIKLKPLIIYSDTYQVPQLIFQAYKTGLSSSSSCIY